MRKLHLLISLMFLLLFISFSEEIIAEKNESGELDKVLERVNPDFYEEYKLANKNVRIITEYKEIKGYWKRKRFLSIYPIQYTTESRTRHLKQKFIFMRVG
ncbi:hypothetical protein [Piscibacillus salipiscarius]|uniref:hypothetical protein n=1 Tax=Piscibacillus salipiscarius TaxID=299480 RepID=UPI0006CF9CA5|nr:hypothetical protein [Piscibacillus salipiscarius]